MTTAFATSSLHSTLNNPGRDISRSSQPSSVDLPALQSANRVLHEQFNKDAVIIPDIGDTLASQTGQVSGAYSVFPQDYRVPFQKRKFVTIPEGLFEYFENASGVTHMGLMPEIERAWISYDTKLFFWDYVDGREISSFVDQNDVIRSVHLVRPKKGLFIDEISYLLVVITPVTVILLGVSFPPPPAGGRKYQDLRLYATDFKLNTDVEMMAAIGTPDGRIFMCGVQDGCLYELHYQESESWFGKRMQLINHSIGGVQSLLPRFAASNADDKIMLIVPDDSRSCFYTLTAKSVSIYRLHGEKSIQHIQTITNLFKAAQSRAPGHPALTPEIFVVQSLHVVNPTESRSGIQFFLVTINGVRLYFGSSSVSNYAYNSSGNTNVAARPVQLVHVRLPPTNLIHPDAQINQHRPPATTYGAPQVSAQPTSRPFQIAQIENCDYFHALTIAAHPGDRDGNDYILCMSPDLTRIGTLGQLNLPQRTSPSAPNEAHRSVVNDGRPALTEYATLLGIPGRTWAIGKVPTRPKSPVTEGPTPAVINELATQFGEYPQQFILLTNSGLSYVTKRRAVDFLRAILEEIQTEGNVQSIVEFRDSFGRDQTCCMLLGLACGNTFLDIPDDSMINSAVTSPHPDVSSVAKQAFYDLGERPTWTERVTYGTSESHGTAVFSGRREGLSLYLSRLIRPIWKAKLTKPGLLNRQKLGVEDETIVTIQKNLYLLNDFLDKNPHLFHSSPSEASSRVPVAEPEAWRAEQNSVSELLSLLQRTIEALSFVLLLSDYMLGDLIAQCDPETQKLIVSQTFETLITTQDGMTVSRALVNVIIDQQIGQQISIDTISEVLQQRCGSFCSTDDVMLYKAKENIRKAAESRNPLERQKWLAESLRLFKKGVRNLEFDKLREICGDYQQLNYAQGAVELPLTCAEVLDSDNIGLEAWHAGLPKNDTRTEFAERRLRCYDLVLDSLAVFEEKSNSAVQVTGNGVTASNDHEAVRAHAYELSFASDDEVFHSTLYDWLINRGLADDLLETRPVFLEAHLRREPVTVQNFQLLWQFYVKNGQSLRAAETLAALAESSEFDLGLDARLEYLTLAVANAKSHPISAAGRHETAIAFLTDLEEKLDVAQVQLEIYNVLFPHKDDAPEVGERVTQLTRRLFTMTELYQTYAIPFDIPDIKLLCLHVSEHRDETVVKPIWNQIFDEILREDIDPLALADRIISRVVPLGRRFYPSESAFPLRYVATLIVRFTLANKNVVSHGWAPRLLIQCGVPFNDVWDVFHEMYESQIPPFNDQTNVQTISSDIAVLLSDWLKEASQPHSFSKREEFPVGRIDREVDQYLAELEPGRSDTKVMYETIKRELRRSW